MRISAAVAKRCRPANIRRCAACGSKTRFRRRANSAGSARPGWPARPAARGRSAQVELFESIGFAGRVFPVNGAVEQFPERVQRSRELDDHPRAAIGKRARTSAIAAGARSSGPGRYPNLGGMANRISSRSPRRGPGTVPERRRLGQRRARAPLRRPEPVGTHDRPQQRSRHQPRGQRIQRSRLVAAHRRRLLDVLQRRQFPANA